MKRSIAEREYDALVYWRNRIQEQREGIAEDDALPREVRALFGRDVDKALAWLNDEIAQREHTLESRP